MKRPYLVLLAALSLPVLLGGARRPASIPVPQLLFPLACRLDGNCAVQNYVDADPGPAPHDYLCRGRTYDGHNGVDFRVDSQARMHAGVDVLAAAAGRVLRVRDGVPDTPPGGAAIKGEECGNGLVVDDGGGWETQYCHMAAGSIRVRAGKRVRAGAVLGRVGMSGDTEFPHLHLTVRKDNRVVDPFAYNAPAGSCGGGRPLWRDRIGYQSGQVLVAGFAQAAPTMADAQANGADQRPRPTRDGAALVAFVQAIGLERGDVQHIAIQGPDARVVAEGSIAPLDHDKAQTIMSVGRRTPPAGWAPGVYQATYTVARGGVKPITRTFRITL